MPSPVSVSIYDLTFNPALQGANNLFLYVGLGAFHAGLVIYDQEWSFGSKLKGTGVFVNAPGKNPRHAFRERVPIGHTEMPHADVTRVVRRLQESWIGVDYDPLHKNCVHFCDILCAAVGVPPLPPWVGRTANYGGELVRGLQMNSNKLMEFARTAGAVPPEPMRIVSLGFESGADTMKFVMATRRPLGLKWRVSKIMVVKEVLDGGHASELGIQAGWKLRFINNRDMQEQPVASVRSKLSKASGDLPLFLGGDVERSELKEVCI